MGAVTDTVDDVAGLVGIHGEDRFVDVVVIGARLTDVFVEVETMGPTGVRDVVDVDKFTY